MGFDIIVKNYWLPGCGFKVTIIDLGFYLSLLMALNKITFIFSNNIFFDLPLE
jgi:hypothetical protein